MIDVVPNAGVIALGKQGENQAVRVTLPNIRAGSGSILLLHQRSDDQKPYPVPVVEADGGIIWTVSSTDTAYPGRGQAELQWLGADGAVVKSATYQTNTIRALATPGAVPDEPLKPYTQAVARDAQAAKDAAINATEAARNAEDSATQAGLSADNAAKSLERLEDGIASGDFRGQDGKSAYQLAVDAGFEGTETQWLESLKGAPGDTTAADAAAAAAQKSAEDAQKNATAAKAESARTARSLDYLWKQSKGIIYDTETVTGAGSSVTVPSGAMDYAALRKLGGMSRKGRNLLNHDAWASVTAINGTAVFEGNGVTITAVKNDAYTNQARFPAAAQIAVAGGDSVALTWEADTNTDGKVFVFPDGNVVGSKSVNNATAKRLDYVVPSGITYITFRFGVSHAGDTIRYRNIMIQINATTTDWEPYTESILNAPVDAVRVANAAGDSTNTYPIPQAIRDLCPDYGQGAVDAYNYIDFTAKTYHHAGSMSQDGTWTALATPEIIDLSAVWPDDFGVLRVEAGGTINLHYPALDDGFELAVPSETEIMVDVAKVVGTDG